MSIDHDSHYKRIFFHPTFLKNFLAAFLSHCFWFRRLDFSTLKFLPSEHVGRYGQKRLLDFAVQFKTYDGQWVILLFEFQSTVDRLMTRRMKTYCSLVEEKLAELHRSRTYFVVPIVVYNGTGKWTASTVLSPFTLKGSDQRPYVGPFYFELVNFLTQQDRVWELSDDNVAVLFVRLETARVGAELKQAAAQFMHWYQQDGDDEHKSLKYDILTWYKQYLEKIKDEQLRKRIQGVEDMGIFAENLERWAKEKKEEGKEEGNREMLALMVTCKFGAEVSEQLTQTYARLTTPELRARFVDWVILSENAKQLLHQIHSSSNGIRQK